MQTDIQTIEHTEVFQHETLGSAIFSLKDMLASNFDEEDREKREQRSRIHDSIYCYKTHMHTYKTRFIGNLFFCRKVEDDDGDDDDDQLSRCMR